MVNNWVKCSSVDSAPEEAVAFEVEEYWGSIIFVDGGGVVGIVEAEGNVV